jgi:hypothetical protein
LASPDNYVVASVALTGKSVPKGIIRAVLDTQATAGHIPWFASTGSAIPKGVLSTDLAIAVNNILSRIIASTLLQRGIPVRVERTVH